MTTGAVWAIADLHLAHGMPDGRDRARFGARWRDHAEQIAAAWRSTVARDDLVLLPGDLSAAGNHRDVQPDLAWLARLPGAKVLAPGNHDRWWNSAAGVAPMLRPGQFAVDGTAIETSGAIVCGARGAAADDPDAPAMAAALAALDLALAEAAARRAEGQPLYVLWHYPPFDRRGRAGPVVARLEAAGATVCVFGHLHQVGQWAGSGQGVHGGVLYRCVAADAIGFRPLRIDRAAAPPRR